MASITIAVGQVEPVFGDVPAGPNATIRLAKNYVTLFRPGS
jgi:hypothetical protein